MPIRQGGCMTKVSSVSKNLWKKSQGSNTLLKKNQVFNVFHVVDVLELSGRALGRGLL